MDRTTVAVSVCIALVFGGIIGGLTYVNTVKYQSMADMVAKGANPMAVHCALDGINQSNQAVCQTLASTGQLTQVNK